MPVAIEKLKSIQSRLRDDAAGKSETIYKINEKISELKELENRRSVLEAERDNLNKDYNSIGEAIALLKVSNGVLEPKPVEPEPKRKTIKTKQTITNKRNPKPVTPITDQSCEDNRDADTARDLVAHLKEQGACTDWVKVTTADLFRLFKLRPNRISLVILEAKKTSDLSIYSGKKGKWRGTHYSLKKGMQPPEKVSTSFIPSKPKAPSSRAPKSLADPKIWDIVQRLIKHARRVSGKIQNDQFSLPSKTVLNSIGNDSIYDLIDATTVLNGQPEMKYVSVSYLDDDFVFRIGKPQ